MPVCLVRRHTNVKSTTYALCDLRQDLVFLTRRDGFKLLDL